jgi:hypothetical protein
MNSRLIALATAAASLTLMTAGVATTAQAASPSPAPNCAAYPDPKHNMTADPSYAKVNSKSVVKMNGHLRRNGKPCPDKRVGFYARKGGNPTPPFTLGATNKDTTDEAGDASISYVTCADVRWYANYDVSATQPGAASPVNLLQTNAAVPDAPKSASRKPTASGNTVSWTKPLCDGDSPLTAYWVYRTSANGGADKIATVDDTKTTFTDVKPPAGSGYYVRAVNKIGPSSNTVAK